MSESKMTKQAVKDYLDLTNKDLAKEMKEKIERQDKWSDFKTELTSLVTTYANSPTPQNRQKLDSLISANYITNLIFAKDAIDKIIKDLGIREKTVQSEKKEKKEKKDENGEVYRRAIYEKLGIEYAGDVLKRYDKAFQNRQDAKYGIIRNTHTSQLTSLDLKEPKKIPSKKLEKNRKKINETSEKIEKLIAELKRAHEIVKSRNKANQQNIPDDIKEIYDAISEQEVSEETIEGFEETLSQKSGEQLTSLREMFETLQASDLDIKLRASKLSDKELEKLARNFRDLTKMNPSSREYAVAKFIMDNPEMLPDDADAIMDKIDSTSKEHLMVKDIAKEIEFKHKILISIEIQGQFKTIRDIIQEYDEREQANGELNENDEGKRKLAMKIANKKVKLLEKAGLTRVITEGERNTNDVLKRAKSVLLPQLENARDKDAKKMQKNFQEPEQAE